MTQRKQGCDLAQAARDHGGVARNRDRWPSAGMVRAVGPQQFWC